jgi:hypothetical protein
MRGGEDKTATTRLMKYISPLSPPNFYITAQTNRFMLCEKITTVHCENHNKHVSTVLQKHGISHCERRWYV